MIERERDCRGDLVARARRERLSQAENLALQAHLTGCAPCRLSRNVFSDFSEMSTVDHRDDARIEDLSALARRWTQGRVRLRRRRGAGRARLRFMAFAAGLALLTGTASAAIWIRRRTAEAAATPAGARAIPERAPTRRTVAAQIGSSGSPGSSGLPGSTGLSGTCVTPGPDGAGAGVGEDEGEVGPTAGAAPTELEDELRRSQIGDAHSGSVSARRLPAGGARSRPRPRARSRR